MATRESAQALLDAIPDAALERAEAALWAVKYDTYPAEDEELAPAELASLERGRRDFAEGRWHTDEEVERRLAQFELLVGASSE